MVGVGQAVGAIASNPADSKRDGATGAAALPKGCEASVRRTGEGNSGRAAGRGSIRGAGGRCSIPGCMARRGNWSGGRRHSTTSSSASRTKKTHGYKFAFPFVRGGVRGNICLCCRRGRSRILDRARDLYMVERREELQAEAARRLQSRRIVGKKSFVQLWRSLSRECWAS